MHRHDNHLSISQVRWACSVLHGACCSPNRGSRVCNVINPVLWHHLLGTVANHRLDHPAPKPPASGAGPLPKITQLPSTVRHVRRCLQEKASNSSRPCSPNLELVSRGRGRTQQTQRRLHRPATTGATPHCVGLASHVLWETGGRCRGWIQPLRYAFGGLVFFIFGDPASAAICPSSLDLSGTQDRIHNIPRPLLI